MKPVVIEIILFIGIIIFLIGVYIGVFRKNIIMGFSIFLIGIILSLFGLVLRQHSKNEKYDGECGTPGDNEYGKPCCPKLATVTGNGSTYCAGSMDGDMVSCEEACDAVGRMNDTSCITNCKKQLGNTKMIIGNGPVINNKKMDKLPNSSWIGNCKQNLTNIPLDPNNDKQYVCGGTVMSVNDMDECPKGMPVALTKDQCNHPYESQLSNSSQELSLCTDNDDCGLSGGSCNKNNMFPDMPSIGVCM